MNFLDLFSKSRKFLNYNKMKIKEYKVLIDKISSKEFENKFINKENKKNIKFLCQIILIFYYKIE